ncbi:Methyl-accepting chemotaxis protein [Magnetospirillum sp. LM-5]|uniref:methyl-accepting chemotaxis protein n=1 Tax=Magnetospirillum sp. LM-5 TaxID=2681466 RepID=UPI0013839E5C|nr:methyl-accepting chemotaxis protein [Magnetospirillum sp. LM-5]CAA7612011.1 Methyl-accepting chemotaxis protein [Magnetospirillum sp. LM-5]
MNSGNFSLWKTIRLRHKFVVVAVMFTGVLAGLIGLSAYSIGNQRDFGTVTDLAGRQRMLSQKYAKEVILAAQGIASDHEGTMRLMRESLAALTDGGSVLMNPESGLRVMVAGARSSDTRARLTEQSALLRQFETEAGRYLALPPTDARRIDKLKEVLAVQVQVLQSADQAVKQFSRDTDQHITESIIWQVIAGLVAAMGGIGISWLISHQMVDPLARCAVAALEIAKGNLRIDPQKVTSGDELGQLQESFNEMLFSLREIAQQSRSVCDSLTLAAAQILTSTQEQAAGTKQQAAAVQEITTTVEEINLSSKQVAERSRQVAGTAEAVAASGTAGLQAVHDASVGMEAIREQTETVAENIITLSERTQAVGEIIATVNDIAEQSNLVALNAAIEAADARESGRRFSVVANEIKNLADQAKEATGQVRGILEQTQKGINTSVMLTEEALKRVESGRERTDLSEQVIRQMAANIQDSVHAFQQIVGATNQQQIGLEQVTQALHEIRQASQQTATTTAHLERSSVELTKLGEQLARTLEKYRL